VVWYLYLTVFFQLNIRTYNWQFTSFFPSLSLFIFSLVCIQLGWHLLYWPCFVVSSHTHFTVIHPHFIHANFIYLTCFYEQVVINLFKFFRHYKWPPFHTAIRIHLISLPSHTLVFAISFYFYGANVNVNISYFVAKSTT